MSVRDRERPKGLLKVALLVSCCLLAVVSCDTAPTAPPAPTPTNAPVDTAVPTPTAGANGSDGAAARVSGTVVAASDVAGQPDAPLTSAAVVALPLDAMAAVVGVRPEALPDRDLRFLSLSIDQEVENMEADLTDAQGRYELDLPAGEYVLCLAHDVQTQDDAADKPALPLNVRGCGRLLLEEGEERVVNVSSGFGEIVLDGPEN